MDYLIILFNVIIVLFLVALNGFFVASEFSIVKVRPSRLDALLKEGNRRAVYAKKVTEHLDAFLSVTQLGITIANKSKLFLLWDALPKVPKIVGCNWYVSTDPFFNRFPRASSLKVYPISRSELEPLMKNLKKLVRIGDTIKVED